MLVRNDFETCLILPKYYYCEFFLSDACSGDSGGPLLSNFHNEERGILTYVTGIVSFGNRICGPGPAVYTRVTGYLEFILDNLRE